MRKSQACEELRLGEQKVPRPRSWKWVGATRGTETARLVKVGSRHVGITLTSGRPPRVPQAPPPQQDGDPQGCGCAPRSLGHASSSEGRTPAAGRLHPIRRSPGPSDQLSIMHMVHPAPRPGPQRPVSHTHASSLQLHFIRCNILSTGPTPPHLLRLWAQRW